MRVRVLFFGNLAETRQERQREMQLEKDMTLAALLAHLDIVIGVPVVLAINCQVVKDSETVLLDGDEVAVMPAFSGG